MTKQKGDWREKIGGYYNKQNDGRNRATLKIEDILYICKKKKCQKLIRKIC